MAETGVGTAALARAGAALAARDAALAGADRELAQVVRDAHDLARESIRRIDSVRAEIDAAVAGFRVDDSAEGREFARFLLDKNRDLIAVVTAARAAAEAKTAALQQLTARYQGELPG